MTRTRSPLETAIVAWIALKIVSLLLGFGLTVETLSGGPGTARLNPEVGKALGYISLALIALIVMILVIEGKYLIAACVVAIAVALPLFLVQARGVPLTAPRPVPRQGAGSATTGPAPTPNVPDVTARAVAIPLVELYTTLLADSRLSEPSAIIVQGSSACSHMTTRARAQLERAFLGSAAGKNACQLALGVAAHQHAFGEPQLSLRALRHGASVPPGTRAALFAGGHEVHVQVVATTARTWQIGGFNGAGLPSTG